MYLSHLSLTNFRNFLQLELDLPPGVVVVHGSNAQGKTSLLEAVYLMAIAKSFRAENEYEVVNWHAPSEDGSALVAGVVEKGNERIRVYIGYQLVPTADSARTPPQDGVRPFGVRKQISVSRVKRTAAELVGLVNAVLFNADDIKLVQGPPSLRRRYLDVLMSQVDPSYLKCLQRYQRVLQQRNRLLRMLQERRAGVEELTFWNEELVKEGAWIVDVRYRAMDILADLCRDQHSDLTGGSEDLIVVYKPSVSSSGSHDGEDGVRRAFAVALDASRSREMALGSTVTGPHRDDFALSVNGVDMGTYASRGQARTLALTLRLAEAAYLYSARGEAPIVLLDDVLSEMDSFRRGRVLEKTSQYHQVIITTTEPEQVRGVHLPNASYFEVRGGTVSRAAEEAISLGRH